MESFANFEMEFLRADHRSWRSWLCIPAVSTFKPRANQRGVAFKLHISNTTNAVAVPQPQTVLVDTITHNVMLKLLLLLSLWTLTATAQFGFFDQMFGNNGGQQQQQQANVRSDSSWYQAQYENGEWCLYFSRLHSKTQS